MKINNTINSSTNSLGWTAFTTTITATTTAPTFGAGTVMKSYYLQQGKILSITFTLQVVPTGSSDGSGTYLFSIPSEFSMDTSILSFNNMAFSLGNASAFYGGGIIGQGTALAYDPTHYVLYMFTSMPAGAANFISGTWFQATGGPYYNVNLQIPIY